MREGGIENNGGLKQKPSCLLGSQENLLSRWLTGYGLQWKHGQNLCPI